MDLLDKMSAYDVPYPYEMITRANKDRVWKTLISTKHIVMNQDNWECLATQILIFRMYMETSKWK